MSGLISLLALLPEKGKRREWENATFYIDDQNALKALVKKSETSVIAAMKQFIWHVLNFFGVTTWFGRVKSDRGISENPKRLFETPNPSGGELPFTHIKMAHWVVNMGRKQLPICPPQHPFLTNRSFGISEHLKMTSFGVAGWVVAATRRSLSNIDAIDLALSERLQIIPLATGPEHLSVAPLLKEQLMGRIGNLEENRIRVSETAHSLVEWQEPSAESLAAAITMSHPAVTQCRDQWLVRPTSFAAQLYRPMLPPNRKPVTRS